MRIIIDIGHPAHVHLFKNFAREMQKKGHKVLFTCRDREFVLHLLKVYGFEYRNFGKHYKTITGKSFGIVKYVLQMLQTCLIFQPDIFLSHGSLIAALASYVIRKPHVAFEDTFNMEQVRLYMPFTRTVLTGDYPHPALGKREIRYPGYHELAYLHPHVFQPDAEVLSDLGVRPGEKYAIIRFVAWQATHDLGHKGISLDRKIKLVETLTQYLKVYISSEDALPEQLVAYKIPINPEQIHDALYYAHLFIGESATMASECAMFGTPAIIINNSKLGSIENQAEYGLIIISGEADSEQEIVIRKTIDIAQNDFIKQEYTAQRDVMLKDKINLTAFLVWFVENFPSSKKEVRDPTFTWDIFIGTNPDIS